MAPGNESMEVSGSLGPLCAQFQDQFRLCHRSSSMSARKRVCTVGSE